MESEKLPNFALAIKNDQGKMPEWSIGAVSKTVVPFRHPGFESLSFRYVMKTSSPCTARVNWFSCYKAEKLRVGLL